MTGEKKIGIWGKIKANALPIAALAVTGAAVIYGIQAMHIQGIPFLSAAATGEGAQQTVVQITGAGTCTQPPDVSLVANYENFAVTPMQEARVATTAALYLDGDTIAKNSTTTATGTAVTVPSFTACNKMFHVIFGDGSTYYYADSGQIKADGDVVDISKTLKPTGTVTIRLDNESDRGKTSVGAPFVAGTPNNEVVFKIKESDSTTYWGDPKYGVALAGNQYNYTDFTMAPLTTGVSVSNQITCPQSVTSHFGANMVVRCYEVTATDKADGTDGLKGVFTHEFQLTVSPLSGVKPTLNISIGTFDLAGYVENGAIVPAYESKANADIGATNVYADNAVVPY